MIVSNGKVYKYINKITIRVTLQLVQGTGRRNREIIIMVKPHGQLKVIQSYRINQQKTIGNH
ncbi:hypothetical protein DSH72_13320 [Enterococcus faecium]|nr:hypothetical protein [Enterococcus faecium]